MNRILTFTKRNLKEMLRDPIIYIFCLGFPLVMLLLFSLINKYTPGSNVLFELNGLIPGIVMFSYSFVMLLMSLNVSKDFSTSFLKRLFTSPIKSYEFILGYSIPVFIIGIFQSIICEFAGFVISLIFKMNYFSFFSALLVILTQIPMLIIYIALGITFGTILSDKSAPAITAVFISASGILGGVWVPLETLGDFEKIALAFPFYPSTYLGRIITESYHMSINETEILKYTFDNTAIIGLCVLLVWMVATVIISILLFKKQMKK